MSTTDYAYWPFSVEPVASRSPLETEKIEFLETTYDNGYESFRFGINDYGARSKTREGCILERGRRRWEIRLAEGEHRRLIAFVDDFKSAGQAIQQWLNGSFVRQIVHNIHDRLVTPPGAKACHVSDGRVRMIGGIDIPIPTRAGEWSMEVAVRAIRQHWPQAVFENGPTGDRYDQFWEVPFGEIEELFVYRDAEAADAWEEHGAIPELSNTMVHLLADNGTITAVIDERDANTEQILEAIASGLSDPILCSGAA